LRQQKKSSCKIAPAKKIELQNCTGKKNRVAKLRQQKKSSYKIAKSKNIDLQNCTGKKN